jgi:hypothetical protein
VETDKRRLERAVFAGIGFFQGLVFWAVVEWWPDEVPAQAPYAAAMAFAAVAGVVGQLTWTARDLLRLSKLAGATGALFSGITFWIWSQQAAQAATYSGDQYRITSWILGSVVALYILGPYIQVYQQRGRLRFPYPDLFFHSWTNIFVVVTGWFYAGLFWALLELWGELFDIIGINFFKDLFEERWFYSLATPIVASFGISSGVRSTRVTDALRNAVLAAFHFLLPLLATIAILFVLALPFTGLQLLWGTKHAAALLITMQIALVLFINAVFQNGEEKPPYWPWLRRIVEASLLTLPVYAGLSVYALGLRIDQYGLTPDQVYGRVIAYITATYSVGYALAVVSRRDSWLGLLRPINIGASLLVTAVIFFLHTPLLDPIRISVNNQVERLLEGRVLPGEFDYAFLRFKLGQLGQEALVELITTDHASGEAIRLGAQKAMDADYYSTEKNETLHAKHFILHGDFELSAEAIAEQLRAVAPRYTWEHCINKGLCHLFQLDVNRNQQHEICVLGVNYSKSKIACYDPNTSPWRLIADLQPISSEADGYHGASCHMSEVLESLKAGQVYTVPPLVDNIAIGEFHFDATPATSRCDD